MIDWLLGFLKQLRIDGDLRNNLPTATGTGPQGRTPSDDDDSSHGAFIEEMISHDNEYRQL